MFRTGPNQVVHRICSRDPCDLLGCLKIAEIFPRPISTNYTCLYFAA